MFKNTYVVVLPKEKDGIVFAVVLVAPKLKDMVVRKVSAYKQIFLKTRRK